MADTPREKLETAIREYAAETRQGEYVTDWFLVASTAIPTQGATFGYITVANGIPYHSCVGLLEVARQRVDDEAFADDDDEDDGD